MAKIVYLPESKRQELFLRVSFTEDLNPGTQNHLENAFFAYLKGKGVPLEGDGHTIESL